MASNKQWIVVYRSKNTDKVWNDGERYSMSDGTYPDHCECFGLGHSAYIFPTKKWEESGQIKAKWNDHCFAFEGLCKDGSPLRMLCQIDILIFMAQTLDLPLVVEFDGHRFAYLGYGKKSITTGKDNAIVGAKT